MLQFHLRSALLTIGLGLPLLLTSAQTPATGGAADEEPPPRVSVPIYPNVSCPIMGKPISSRLTVDTDMGRFWVCCKGCDDEILLHVEDSHRTAYPVVQRLENETCPVSGRAIDEEKAQRVVLQGFDFVVCCPRCVDKARKDSQAVLARLNDPKLVDLKNGTCPVSLEPAVLLTIAVIDDTIVRFASPLHIAEAEREPDKVLAKARELREQELEQEREAAGEGARQ